MKPVRQHLLFSKTSRLRGLATLALALVAFTLPACSRSWRRHVMNRFGVVANGLEPRDSRRQLEQLKRLGQSQELPVSQQQQQPGQQEQ